MTNASGFMTPPVNTLSHCRFAPCVGPHYDEGAFNGLKLLVLGESHYRWPNMPTEEHTLTQYVVEAKMHGKPGTFVRGVTASLLGGASSRHTEAERLVLWQAVAFYNYSQEFAGDRPRQRPTRDHWESAQVPFRQVLDLLAPDVVLVFGKTLWKHVRLIEGLSDEPYVNPKDELERSRVSRPNGRVTVLGMVAHPASTGFSAREWAPRVQNYFMRAHALNGPLT